MKKYHVYTLKVSYNRSEKQYDPFGFVRMETEKVVLANNRTDAIKKCLPEIIQKIEKITDQSIKYISVYAGLRYGKTEKAERLTPIQIDVYTKEIRKVLQ